jgi:murein DD-endopeptidase MepM/ murein hydrolase activator NlpD
MTRRITMMVITTILFAVSLQGWAGTLFRLPLSSNPGYAAWFDHNATTGSKKRYDCATSFEYDGHKGTDFATPIGRYVYAAAKGSLYYRVDGCPDGSSPTCGSSYGNHVRVEHPDGLVTIYAHLKNGSPAWFMSIFCGGQLGVSGNSGYSSGPHLHFELWQHTSIGKRLDFFKGSCNSTGYWVNQNNGWPTTKCQ